MRKTLVRIYLSGCHLVIEPVCRGIGMRRDFYLSIGEWEQLNRKEGRVIARNNDSFADFQLINALDLLRIDFFWLNTLEGNVSGRQETVYLTYSHVRDWVWAGAQGIYRQVSINPRTPNQVIRLISKE
ncbi:MAG: hypothetical protein K6T65_07185 [Peptococcaceae bacterium]|nr:hypothetical protein [Peptococcaceae bacterium]